MCSFTKTYLYPLIISFLTLIIFDRLIHGRSLSFLQTSCGKTQGGFFYIKTNRRGKERLVRRYFCHRI